MEMADAMVTIFHCWTDVKDMLSEFKSNLQLFTSVRMQAFALI